MRIAQIAPLAESVPPKLYGGTERVVAWLVDELVKLGHEVTLFASGDSRTRANLKSVWPRALRLGRPRSDPMAAQAALLEAMSQHAAEFDVIHAHIDWLHLPLLSRLGVPFVTTPHGRLDLPGLSDVVRRFPDAPFVSISNNQRVPLGDANWVGTVYHGLPADMFRPAFEPGSYLAFSAGSPPRRGLKFPFALPVPPECRFTSRRKCRVAREATSKKNWSHRSTAIRSNSRGKSTTKPKRRFSRRRGFAVSDRLARAFRSGHDRSDGVWHAGYRVPVWLGAGSYR